jgi:hypothetical protein
VSPAVLDIPLQLVHDFNELAAGRRILAPTVGPGGEAMLLLARQPDARVLAGRDKDGFADTRTHRPVGVEIVIPRVRRVPLNGLSVAHPLLQPMPDEQLLVVGARCSLDEDGVPEQNAQVYDAAGELRAELGARRRGPTPADDNRRRHLGRVFRRGRLR